MIERTVAIARTTYRELVRSKVLYAVFFFSGVLLLLASFFGTVTIGDQAKVIKDFGLFSISIFATAFAVISGTTLLSRELGRKTIFNILGKPVYRSEFLWGKYLGMLLTSAVLILVMAPCLLLYLRLFESRFDFGILLAALYIYLEVALLCAAAMFFSSIVVTPALSGLFTFSLFLAGRCTEYLNYFIDRGEVSWAGKMILKALYWILPHLNELSISDGIVYGTYPGVVHLGWALLYTTGYSVVMLSLAGYFFNRKEFE